MRGESKRRSVKAKLLLFSLCISLIPVAVITIIYYLNTRNTLQKHTLNNLSTIVEFKKQHILSFINAKKERTIDFSSDGLIKRNLEKTVHDGVLSKGSVHALNRHLLANKKFLDTSIVAITVIDNNNKIVASTDEHLVGINVSGYKPFVPGTKRNNNKTLVPVVQPYLCPIYNINCLSVIAPITSSRTKGKTLGFVINCYDLATLCKITSARSGMGNSGEVYLVNRDKVMITESRFIEGSPLKQVVDTEPVRKILEDGKETTGIYLDYRGIPVVGASAYIQEYDWVLLAEIDKEEAFAPLKTLNIVALNMGLICTAAVTSVGIIFAFSTARPINILRKATEKFRAGNLEMRVNIETRDEIGDLARSFNAMADALALETHKLSCAVEQSPCAVIVTDIKGNTEYINPRFTQLTSYTSEEVLGENPRILKSGEKSPEEYRKLWDTITSGKEWRGEFCNRKKNGSIYWASASISPVRNSKGVITNFVGIQEDITERKQTEEILKETVTQRDKNIDDLKHLMRYSTIMNDEVLEKVLFEHMSLALKGRFQPDVLALLTLDKGKNIIDIPLIIPQMPVKNLFKSEIFIEPSLCRVIRTGQPFISKDIQKDPSCECTHDKILEGSCACFPLIAGGTITGVVLMIKKESGYWNNNEILELLSTYIGLTASALHRVRLMETTKQTSVTDALTGVYNRRFFDEMIEKQIALAKRHNESLSILIIDLDYFKKVNDTYGHIAGDYLLREITGVMRYHTRSSDILARYGGEEFIIIMPMITKAHAVEKAGGIRQHVESHDFNTIVAGKSIRVTVSIGVATYPEHGIKSDILIHAADSALYKAKRAGRNRVDVP